jgi:RNA polymerase sigma factor (sigma-70 family)
MHDLTSGMEVRLASLMRTAQEGDSAAYAELLAAVSNLLRDKIGRRMHWLQTQDIEDLVQDTLLSLHAVRATYDPHRPFLPWLMAIARNRVADGARRYARRTANEVVVDELPETFSEDAANIPGEGYGDPEALRQAMETLPPGQRRAVEMLKLKEMSLKEASAESGMSVGSLKIAVHRGVSALRKVLSAETQA